MWSLPVSILSNLFKDKKLEMSTPNEQEINEIVQEGDRKPPAG